MVAQLIDSNARKDRTGEITMLRHMHADAAIKSRHDNMINRVAIGLMCFSHYGNKNFPLRGQEVA